MTAGTARFIWKIDTVIDGQKGTLLQGGKYFSKFDIEKHSYFALAWWRDINCSIAAISFDRDGGVGTKVYFESLTVGKMFGNE